MRTIVLSLCAAGLAACATSPSPDPARVSAPIPVETRIPAVALSRDGSTLWFARGNDTCELRALSIADGSERLAFELGWCPTKITQIDDDSLVLTDGVRLGSWKRLDGTDAAEGAVLAASSASNLVVAKDGRVVWIRNSQEHDLGAAGELRSPVVLPGSGELMMIARNGGEERIVRAAPDGLSEVSAAFSAIDSFAVAPRGDEIVYSARRDGSFDVAISSPDGKTVNWIPSDSADEVGVTWAPRGNKVTYLIRRVDSTLVRSVHVPTSFQLTFETPFEAVRALGWDPRAERVAMILDGPGISPHVDWIEYSGANRASLIQPARRLAGEPERVTFGSESAILVPPRIVRYGEKLPLFVVLTDELLAWGEAASDLEQFGGGVLRVPLASWDGGAPVASLLAELPWAGEDAVIVIAPDRGTGSVPAVAKGQTLLTTGTKPPGDRVFVEKSLPTGAVSVTAASWEDALQYLRERFQPKR